MVREGGLGGVVEEVGGADVLVFGVADDGGLEAVEGEEVADLVRGGVLHHVRPHHLLRRRRRLVVVVVQQPMLDLLGVEFRRHVESPEIAGQEVLHGFDVFCLHGPETGGGRCAR